MTAVFLVSAAVALFGTVMVITRRNAVHALLYLILSLLALAVIFFDLGASFAAALEVIVYAGAIMVLFVFVVMMLNAAQPADGRTRSARHRGWIVPLLLAVVLLAELIAVSAGLGSGAETGPAIDPREVGLRLFGPYLLGVELASLLLLAGLVGAWHLGRGGLEARGSGEKEKEARDAPAAH